LTNSHPSGHGHSSLLIETTLTSSRPPSISEVTGKLQDAWKQVRYHAHPLIAVELVLPQVITDTDDYIVYYPDTTPESATIWAQETVIYQPSLHMADLVHAVDSKIYSSGSSGAEIHFSYLPGIGGDDSTLHLVFAAGHWITDRRGAFKILDRLVGYLNSSSSIDLDWGAEVSRLSLPLGVATGRRQANAGNIEHLASGDIETFMHTFMHAHAKAQPSHEKPLQPASIIMPSPQIRSDIVLSETDSHKLLNLCRHHSTTVTALLNVLLAMTYVDNPVKLRSSKTLPIPFFAVHRSHDLVSPYKEGMGLYITIAPFAFAASSIAKCLDGQDEQNKAIWGAAQEAKHQLLAAKVSHSSSSSGIDDAESHSRANPPLSSITRQSPLCFPRSGPRMDDRSLARIYFSQHRWEASQLCSLRRHHPASGSFDMSPTVSSFDGTVLWFITGSGRGRPPYV
jgi:hypothetical protein